jgi:hypothetical protein
MWIDGAISAALLFLLLCSWLIAYVGVSDAGVIVIACHPSGTHHDLKEAIKPDGIVSKGKGKLLIKLQTFWNIGRNG